MSNFRPSSYRRLQPGRAYYTGPARQPVTSVINVDSALWVGFAKADPARAAWLVAKAPTFEFAASVGSKVADLYGRLTQGQMDAIDRMMARDSGPARPTAANPAVPTPVPAQVAYTNIRAAFDKLIAGGHRGGRGGMLTLGDVVLSLAPASGRNEGAVYVKVDGVYSGKIVGTRLMPGRDAPANLSALLAEIEADPVAAVTKHAAVTAARLAAHADAVAAAKANGTPAPAPLYIPCGCCGLTLSDPVSIARGIGPICAGRWGF